VVTINIPFNGQVIATVKYDQKEKTPEISYLHLNYLGSPVIITNERGEVIEKLKRDAWGNVSSSSSSSSTASPSVIVSEANQSQSSLPTSFGFTGHKYDQDSDLTYAHARYLSTRNGVFLSQDPAFWDLPEGLLLDPQSQNSYSYARNNPVNYVDPDGESWKTYFQGVGEQVLHDIPYVIGCAVVSVALVAAGVVSAPALAVFGVGATVYGAGSVVYNSYQTYKAYDNGSIDVDTKDYRAGRLSVGVVELGVGSAGLVKGLRSGNTTKSFDATKQQAKYLKGIKNEEVRKAIKDFYRKEDTIVGGTSGAIHYTKQTGKLLGNSDHTGKGQNFIGRFKNILNTQELNSKELRAVKRLFKMTNKALRQ